MAYSELSDLELKIAPSLLAQLTDDINGSTVDVTIVDRAVSDSDSTIESFARGKHTLPFFPVPDSVRRWSVGLSIFNLYQRRLDLQIPEVVRVSHDDIMTELRALRDNKILIKDPDSSANTGKVYVSRGAGKSKKRIFNTNVEQTGSLDQYYRGL